MKRWLGCLALAIAIGFTVALFMSSAAIDHNPQYEFVSENGEYTAALYSLFTIWFSVAALPSLLVCLLGSKSKSD